jgi:hypothetical protein
MLIEKVEGYIGVIRSLEAMGDARKVEADRLAARAKTAQRGADWLKNRLLTYMQSAGRERIEMARFTLTVRLNNPSVRVVDSELVPAEFWRQYEAPPPQVDKLAILARHKTDGLIPPGVEIVRTPRLALS